MCHKQERAIVILRESSGWAHSLGQLGPESIRFDALDSLEPWVHIPKRLGSTLPPSWAINSMETRLSVWPTFRKDLENRDGVDPSGHVVLSITVGFTEGWLQAAVPKQLSTPAIPGDTSRGFQSLPRLRGSWLPLPWCKAIGWLHQIRCETEGGNSECLPLHPAFSGRSIAPSYLSTLFCFCD